MFSSSTPASGSDAELLDDNPVEFIRRDIEGSDNDTRLRCAADLVRGLCRHFNAEVTSIGKNILEKLLSAAASSVPPGGHEIERAIQKDAALALFISLVRWNVCCMPWVAL